MNPFSILIGPINRFINSDAEKFVIHPEWQLVKALKIIKLKLNVKSFGA
jgi:hypothetical protein